MYNRRLILLNISFIVVLMGLFFVIFQALNNNKNWFGIGIGVIAYLCFIFKMIIDEYKDTKLDMEEGRITNELKLIKFYIFNKSRRNNLPANPIATFYDGKMKKFISLVGDFSKIEMKKGRKYKVTYLTHSKIVIDIERTS